MTAPDLQAATLHARYADGSLTPWDLVAAIHARIEAEAPGGPGLWIDLEPVESLLAQATAAVPGSPLYGLPFAVKDNVDVAGRPTTAACPAFSYQAVDDATLVARLRAAGALYLGKLNLDQFATGLVGTRSPYGLPRNPFGDDLIPGGSSSGSGVAVASGLVTFAIGTDTAGSGRVPAALTNTVGLKPSRGLVSTAGIVPACRSLDCPSVHALNVPDALLVLEAIAGLDPRDPWTRDLPLAPLATHPTLRSSRGLAEAFTVRIGVPPASVVAAVSTPEIAAAFARSRERLEALGAELIEIDMDPFFEAGDLLYDGAWVAERWSGLAEFVTAHPDEVLPVTRGILNGGQAFSAREAFLSIHRLQSLRSATAQTLSDVDAMVLPTITRRPTVAQVEADPIGVNAAMGRWTTFGNLLDLAAIAVPQELGHDGNSPFGVMVVSGAGRDAAIARIAAALHEQAELPVGATGYPLADAAASPVAKTEPAPSTLLVVAGAHMTGLPLNPQLESLGGRFRQSAKTAPVYRMVALEGVIPRPGLIRQLDGAGASLEVEIHELPHEGLGALMVSIKPPLAIGTVTLDDGRELPGFVCEGHAAAWAPDVTESGGWRAHLANS